MKVVKMIQMKNRKGRKIIEILQMTMMMKMMMKTQIVKEEEKRRIKDIEKTQMMINLYLFLI